MTLSVGDVELVDYGVDWLTVSQMRSGSKKPLELLALPLLKQEQKRGNIRRSWGMSGYAGFACGSIQIGIGPQGSLARLGSSLAKRHWRQFYANSDNCSRIDLQLTVRSDTPTHRIITRHFRGAQRHIKSGGPIRTVSMFKSSDGSATLYLGKRISERFGRIYDKAAESKQKEWAGCVRYEVELKGEVGARTAAALNRTKGDDTGIYVTPDGRLSSERHDCPGIFILSHSLRFFGDRGCAVPAFKELPIDTIVVPDHNDYASAIQWLQRQVRPTLKRLSSLDTWPEVVEALGLYVSEEGKIVSR